MRRGRTGIEGGFAVWFFSISKHRCVPRVSPWANFLRSLRELDMHRISDCGDDGILCAARFAEAIADPSSLRSVGMTAGRNVVEGCIQQPEGCCSLPSRSREFFRQTKLGSYAFWGNRRQSAVSVKDCLFVHPVARGGIQFCRLATDRLACQRITCWHEFFFS